MPIIILIIAYLAWELLAAFMRFLYDTPARKNSKKEKEILTSNTKIKW